MTGALFLLAVAALLWCARPRRGKPPAREWPTAEAPDDGPSTPANRAVRRRVPSRPRPPLHRRAHSTATWRARSGAPAARLTAKGTRPTRGRRLKNGKLPRRYRPRPAGVHYLRSPRRAPIRLPEGMHYAWCACGQLKTGTPDELDRWWVRHCSRFDLSTLQAGVDALRGRSPRRERWAHTTRELSVLAHAWLVLREPVRWHPISGARSVCGAARRVVLLAGDVIPAAVTAPSERTTTVPELDDDEHWGYERRTLHRSWRDGRWGWYDEIRGRWYPGIAFAGAATITASATGGNWSANAAWVGGVPPTSADDARLAGTSGGINIDLTTNACRSIDCTGYTATMIWGLGKILSIGDASGGAATFVNTMSTFDGGGGASIKFVSTGNNGGTGWAITSGTKALPTPVFDGVGGKWVLQDAFSAAATTLTVTNGGFFGNGKTITCGVLSSANSNTRTVDITNCTMTVSGAGSSAVQMSTSTGLTFTSTGSTVTLSGAAGGMALGTNSSTWATVSLTGSGSPTITATTSTFTSLTRTGTAAKADGVLFTGNVTVTGTLTLGGNTTQGVNRLLAQSSTAGSQRTFTMTGAAVVISGDVDFMDIAITGSPSWTNTGSKFVGDALGNGSLITTNRTTPATQTWTGDVTDNWSTAARWTSRVPLPQDNVVIAQAFTGSKTISIDMPRFGANVDFTGTTGNPTLTNNVASTMYGSITFVAAMTLTLGTNNTLAGRGSHTITMAGKSYSGNMSITAPGGTYTLADAFSTGGDLSINPGTFTTNDNNMTVRGIAFSTAGGTVVANFGISTVTITYTNAVTVFNVATPAAVTMNASSATFVLSAASANTRTFAGGGKTYGTLTYTVAGSTGALAISGSNTWAGAWNMSDATNARLITITNGTTQTFTSTSTFFNVTGSSGKLTTFTSASAGSAFTLTKTSSAAVFVDFVSLKDSTATGGLWVDGPNYTNVSGNTGWTFADKVMTGADTGSGDSTTTVAFTGAETGSGADAASLAAALTSPDTGTGADAATLAASMANADVGTGSEASSLAVAGSASEIGSGADAGTSVASMAGSDTGSSVDASTLTSTLSIADAATGDDESTIGVSLIVPDGGSGAESSVIAVAAAGQDDGQSADGGTIEAAVTGSDTATGSDLSSIMAEIVGVDDGAGDESSSAVAAVIGDETGAGVESVNVAEFVVEGETGSAIDVAALVALIVGGDAGVAAESMMVGVSGADVGHGLDAGSARPVEQVSVRASMTVAGRDTSSAVAGRSTSTRVAGRRGRMTITPVAGVQEET